jgi:hypothetical protein
MRLTGSSYKSWYCHSVMSVTAAPARGQHHVPQFLLRGFRSRTKRDQSYSYLFRRGAAPHETNVKNIGKRRDFYGNPAHSNLEEAFSERESSYAALVSRILLEEPVPSDKPQIAIICRLGFQVTGGWPVVRQTVTGEFRWRPP